MARLYPVLTALLLSILLGLPRLTAQEDPASGASGQVDLDVSAPVSKPDISAGIVEEAKATMEADTTIDESIKGSLRSRYDETLKVLREADEFEKAEERFETAIELAPPQTTELREELEQIEATPVEPTDVPGETFEEVQTNVDATQTRIDRLQHDLDRLEKLLEELQRRPVIVSERVPEVQNELAQVTTSLAAPELAGDNLSTGRRAEKLHLQAQELRLRNEADMLGAEQRSQAERTALVTAQVQLAEQKLQRERALMSALQSKLRSIVRRETERLADAVSETASAGQTESLDRKLAAELEELVAELEEVVDETNGASLLEARVEQRSSSFRREFELVQAQLEVGQAGEKLAPLFFELSRRLRTQHSPEQIVAEARTLLDKARLDALLVEDKFRRQRELEEQVGPNASPATLQMLDLRRKVLEKLRIQYRALVRELARLVTDSRHYVQGVTEARAFLSEKLFLVRSTPPMSLETITRLPEALAWLFEPDHFVRVGGALQAAAASRPFTTGLTLLLVVGLLLARPRICASIEAATRRTRRISEDQYRNTLAALFYSILLALPIPILLGYLYFALSSGASSDEWLWSLRRPLPAIVCIAATALFISAICREGGLWQHFGWERSTVRIVRRCFLLYAIVYIPAAIVVATTVHSRDAQYFESLGRIAIMIGQVWTAMLLWKLLCSDEGVLAQSIREHPTRISIRWRWAWIFLAIGLPVLLTLFAIAGYVMTAIELSFEVITITGLVIGGAFTYWMVLRWFMIRERKMALAEAIERRRKAREAARQEGDDPESNEIVTVEEDENSMDLSAIGDQTRRLLRSSFVLAIAGIVVMFLANNVPVLNTIDELPVFGNVSLLELIQMALVLLGTIVLAINIPGLLALGLLHPMNIAAGTRHAIQTLVQYTIVVVGVGIFLAILQIDWVQFGWIVAALSLGIGFGLQEVITNFVCGILILFERPIRVGDIVSIEGTTGTVSKIQMRSTTIVNWDRQELVVPNKNFITGTLLNWSLSNALNRLTLPVGVAYGSDTTRALQILREIATEHPLILDDPAPLISFEEFGDSTLNLVLRCYLPDLDNRIGVTTDLHQTIIRRFDEAGIVIAFPQRDLNLGVGWEKLLGNAQKPSF